MATDQPKKRGRKKTGFRVRSSEVSFSLTPEDAHWLTEVAALLGVRSRAMFMTGIVEQLRAGGLAPVVWFRIGWQVRRLAEARGVEAKGFHNPFSPLPDFELIEDPRPQPAMPVESMAPAEQTQALRELEAALQTV